MQKRCRGRKRHGYARHGRVTPEYRSWQGAIRRCYSPENKDYPQYGGRGIRMCPRWFDSFEAFLADMGPRPKPKRQYSIDRIDVNGHYEPSNCRWATYKQQEQNRRSTVWLTFKGETLTQFDWSKRLGIPNSVINERLSRGMPVDEALSTTLRRSYFTVDGKTQRLSDWARERGLNPIVVTKRRRRGWTDEQALGFAAPPHRK